MPARTAHHRCLVQWRTKPTSALAGKAYGVPAREFNSLLATKRASPMTDRSQQPAKGLQTYPNPWRGNYENTLYYFPLSGLAMGFVCAETFAQHTNKHNHCPTDRLGMHTANLQSAFDRAVAEGRGCNCPTAGVELQHSRQIVAHNFKGAFIGAGAEKSVLTNLPNLVVKRPIFLYDSPPTRPTHGRHWLPL